jgi:hypothetical protein
MKKKIVKWGIALILGGVVIGGGTVVYMFNMPHRNVQDTPIDYQMEAKNLVHEYLKDAKKANDRYLQEEGESKIIAVTGIVASVDEDLNHQKVVLLRDSGESAGVSCTFMASTNINAEKLKNGDKVTIKGVIRSGAGYDEDLELYEDVIIEKCDVIQI